MPKYGEALFNQAFAGPKVYARHKKALQAGISMLRFEIAGPPAFHRLHWEALKDPDLPDAFVLRAPMVRKNLEPLDLEAKVRPSRVIHLLLIVARPRGGRDVGYRTISRPLIDCLRQAGLRGRVDIVRRGDFRALKTQLEAHPAGYCHVVHFDAHGAVLQYDVVLKAQQANRLLYNGRFGR